MWISIYLAKGKENIFKIKSMLEQSGILVMIRKNEKTSDEEAFYEILVPQTEAVLAQDIIIENK